MIILGLVFCTYHAYSQETSLTLRQINEDILFAPEFEGYKYGRRTDGNGVYAADAETVISLRFLSLTISCTFSDISTARTIISANVQTARSMTC